QDSILASQVSMGLLVLELIIPRECRNCRPLIVAVLEHDVTTRPKMISGPSQDQADRIQPVFPTIERSARFMA
ncbi:MAG: hypothetical protein ABGZ17_15265, partial [Planctomycetaceae bacterium]